MVHILLLILKIIGIILLAVLGLCLLILFFPVTYRVKGDFEGKEFCYSVKCGWLLHLLHFGGKFSNNEKAARIRILGIPINLLKSNSGYDTESNLKKNKAQPEKKKHKNNKKDRVSVENNQSLKPEQFIDEKIDNNILKQEQNQTDQRHNQQKKGFIDKIKDVFRTVYYFIKKVWDTIKKALKDVRGAYNKAKEIKSFISASTTKEAYQYGKRIIIKTIKHIFPTRIKAKLHFGFEQPDITGKVLGYIAMAFSAFDINVKRISIIPDFNKKVIEGNIKVKGHFFIGILLIYALKFYFKKEIHDIIKRFS